MEPKITSLEKEKHLQTINFLGSMLVFGGVGENGAVSHPQQAKGWLQKDSSNLCVNSVSYHQG